jgi:putative transposase
MELDSKLRRGRSVVYSLSAHLVFVPKYRRAVFSEEVWATARLTFEKVCRDFEAVLIEASCEPDHVHLLVEYPPKVALSHLVNSLKGVSARRLRQAQHPEVIRALRGDAFWSPSYCAISTGGAALDVVKQYIQDQRGPSASSRPAVDLYPSSPSNGEASRGSR